MRMSCNGCRVLRKGCSDNCTIRPCLHWIPSSESQAHATLFLAKFYGRAGLLNLIDSAPSLHRPAVFKSLLYEACGRMVNPIYGAVGLLWTGNWAQCQAAVEAVFKGSPIMQCPPSGAPPANQIPPLRNYDIRHLPKDSTSADVMRVRTRTRFKRTVPTRPRPLAAAESMSQLAPSWESWLSQLGNGDSKEEESMVTAEGSSSVKFDGQTDGCEDGLELTLGLVPQKRPRLSSGAPN